MVHPNVASVQKSAKANRWTSGSRTERQETVEQPVSVAFASSLPPGKPVFTGFLGGRQTGRQALGGSWPQGQSTSTLWPGNAPRVRAGVVNWRQLTTGDWRNSSGAASTAEVSRLVSRVATTPSRRACRCQRPTGSVPGALAGGLAREQGRPWAPAAPALKRCAPQPRNPARGILGMCKGRDSLVDMASPRWRPHSDGKPPACWPKTAAVG